MRLDLKKNISTINQALSLNQREIKRLDYPSLAKLVHTLHRDYKKPDLRQPLSESQKRNLRRLRKTLVEFYSKPMPLRIGLNKNNRKTLSKLAGQSSRGWKVAFIEKPTPNAKVKFKGKGKNKIAILDTKNATFETLPFRFNKEVVLDQKSFQQAVDKLLINKKFDFINITMKGGFFLGGADPRNFVTPKDMVNFMFKSNTLFYVLNTYTGVRLIFLKSKIRKIPRSLQETIKRLKRNAKARSKS